MKEPLRRAFMTEDPAEAQRAAGDFLLNDPVRHSILLSVLQQRLSNPTPGRYWWTTDDRGRVTAYAMQSPLNFFAALSPADPLSIDALVRQAAEDAPELPGVMGEAATAASFAGTWTERLGIPARPVEGQRVYQLHSVDRPSGVAGRLRRATAADRHLLLPWTIDFLTTGNMPLDPVEALDRHLANDRLWLWDDNGAVSMANVGAPIGGVGRIGFVYTPPDKRRRGYASALVAAVSKGLLADGADSCMLYAQLHNPTSNSIYRRMGYRAVTEILHYRFGTD